MKNLILLLSIITICYSCQQQPLAPSTPQSLQLQPNNNCQLYGACSEAIYESSSSAMANPPYDTVIYTQGSTTQLAQVKLTFIGYGPTKTGVPSDTFLYKVTNVNTDFNLLDTNFMFIRSINKNNTIQFFGLHTKHGTWCIYRFKQYI